MPLEPGWPGLSDGQVVLVGVRPEDVSVGDEGVAGIVEAAEWLGHEQILQVRVGDDIVSLRDASDRALPHVGADVRLNASARALSLFDAISGQRLDRTA